jgi:predicted HTH transcriptional regulator
MAITDQTSKVIKNELDRLNKERDQIEETIKKLEDALVSMTRSAGSSARKAVSRKPGRKRGRPAGKSAAKKAPAKKAAKDWKPSGRAAQALKIIKVNPGISAAEVAAKLKLKNSPAIYPAINKLKDQGFVKKQGKGYTAK